MTDSTVCRGCLYRQPQEFISHSVFDTAYIGELRSIELPLDLKVVALN
jgi:hypothetical protein